MSAKTVELILERINALPEASREVVLCYLDNLAPVAALAPPGPLAKHFGVLSPEAADAMERAIEEGFEQVNPDEWKRLP